jgi:hypothetical protein
MNVSAIFADIKMNQCVRIVKNIYYIIYSLLFKEKAFMNKKLKQFITRDNSVL